MKADTVVTIASVSSIAALVLAASWNPAGAEQSRAASIDGTYELVEHVMLDGTVVRPPAWTALYTMRQGRFSLNLFFKNPDGTLASESTIGRYTFTATKYCEWITYTTRNNLGRRGATNEVPALTDHCAPVTSKNAQYSFAPPGEGVVMHVNATGFTAVVDSGGGTDRWAKIR